MAIGFDYGGASNAVPDKTLSRKSKPKVLKAVFGDGYEQRVSDGINSLGETYSVRFKNREKAFIDDVSDFLDDQKGVSKFTFTLPDDNNTTRTGEHDVKVVCEDYTTTFDYDDYYTLTAVFKRVYEA